MDAFIVMLKNVIVFVLLAIPGFILSKKGMVKEKESGVLSKVLMYVGMPFLIISTTLNIEFNLQTALVIGISFVATILFYVVLITATTLLVKKPEDDKKKGINYFIKGQALKIMLNYTMYSQSNGQYGSKIYAGTQIIL